MSKKRPYTKRFTSKETLSMIDARIKLNRYFRCNHSNQKKAWNAVAKEAGLVADHHMLSRKWSNLIVMYKKCLESPATTEISEQGWLYFKEMEKWGAMRDKSLTPYSPDYDSTDKESYDHENDSNVVDTSMDSSLTPSNVPYTASDDEVSNLLQLWGLSELKAKFKENYIVLQAFEYLTEQDIVELIPKIGQRAIFRGRLRQWRQQSGIDSTCSPSEKRQSPSPQKSPSPVEPPAKAIKLEPVEEVTITQPQIDEIIIKEPEEIKLQTLRPTDQSQQEIKLANKPLAKLQHKVFGTLTKCNQKSKKPAIVSPKPSAVQSKVKQFYISPMVEASSSPPPPPPPPQPFVRIPSPDIQTTNVTPFVTSIIRVETNCDKAFQQNHNIIDPSSNKQLKVNRTTILQKITCSSPVKDILQQKKPQPFVFQAQQFKSPKITSQQHSPQQHSAQQHKNKQSKSPKEGEPDTCSLYPIIKMETELCEKSWDGFTEPELQPKLGADWQTNPQPEPEPEDAVEEIVSDSIHAKVEYVGSSESGKGSGKKNENSISKLKRIAPEVFRQSRKRQAKIQGKLDIRRVLMNSGLGRHVLNYYETNEVLDVSQRRMLIDVIAQNCWLTNRKIKPTDCKKIADEIIEIFPSEKKEYYFFSPAGKNIQSPLYNKYRNMSRRFFLRNSLPVPIRRKHKSRLSLLEIDGTEADDGIIIL